MKKVILVSLLLVSFVLAGCTQQKPSVNRSLSQSDQDKVAGVIWRSQEQADEVYDKRDPEAVCKKLQSENNLNNCALLLSKRSMSPDECVNGVTPAGCFACKFDCENQQIGDQNDNQASGICEYYLEEGNGIYVTAACNQLMVSFKYGYVSDQTKDEVEKLINSYGGKITSKSSMSEVWFLEIEPEEKLYELKNIINQMGDAKGDISAYFNMVAGLD